ncbi:MAG: Mur ligase family protein [Gammaproteobacteria bacterium]|uniref:bifunctional folylpolyglutamate synthase/dihydrofolate synthase n=1 Tax=Ferrimicrobium acidiphilum TaxID=121039 RepID=UPI0023F0F7C9|nr:Mur ligase family protein [Ferrimicrobium acidiphilum]MCL5053262.1 Mur ligase family protein [Gammaproteobacteria bacterium]
MLGIEWLESLANFEADRSVVLSSLESVRSAASVLGGTESGLRFIHVAGTNGKGSVAAAAAVLLGDMGFRVGLFRSPHLCRLEERVMIDAVPVAAERLDQELCQLAAMTEQKLVPQLTHFEALFVAALSVFSLEGCEIAVVEVGMGGRDDATNIIDAEVAVITSIGHDHLPQLGPELTDVLDHKLGIVHDGATVCIGALLPELRSIAMQRLALNPTIWIEDLAIERFPGVGGQEIVEHSPLGDRSFFVPLYGLAAAWNVVLAVLAVEALLGQRLSSERIESGLARLHLPGCFEVLRGEHILVVDTAHNPEAAASLGLTLVETFGSENSVGVVFGMSHDRDPSEFLRSLAIVDVEAFGLLDCGVSVPVLWKAATEVYPEARILDWSHELRSVGELIGSLGTEVVLITGSHCACGTVLCKDPPKLLLDES